MPWQLHLFPGSAYIYIYIYVAGTFGVYFVPPDIHVLYMHLYKNINDLHAYKISAESCIFFLSLSLRSVRFLIQKRLWPAGANARYFEPWAEESSIVNGSVFHPWILHVFKQSIRQATKVSLPTTPSFGAVYCKSGVKLEIQHLRARFKHDLQTPGLRKFYMVWVSILYR